LSRFLAEKIISPENFAGKTSIDIIPQINIKNFSRHTPAKDFVYIYCPLP
jgi:hypothetical protein